jgi:hypothetical protein
MCHCCRQLAAREFCFCVRPRGAPLTSRKSLPVVAGRGAFSNGVLRGFLTKRAQKTELNFAFSDSRVRTQNSQNSAAPLAERTAGVDAPPLAVGV